MARSDYPITISKKILEEMINVRVFECETNLNQRIFEYVKPANTKALAAQDLAQQIWQKQEALEIRVDPFIRKVDESLSKHKAYEKMTYQLKDLEKMVAQYEDRLGTIQERMTTELDKLDLRIKHCDGVQKHLDIIYKRIETNNHTLKADYISQITTIHEQITEF